MTCALFCEKYLHRQCSASMYTPKLTLVLSRWGGGRGTQNFLKSVTHCVQLASKSSLSTMRVPLKGRYMLYLYVHFHDHPGFSCLGRCGECASANYLINIPEVHKSQCIFICTRMCVLYCIYISIM